MRLFNCWCYLIIKVVCGILKTKEINMGMKLNDFTAIKIYYNDSRVRFDYFCGRKASCGTASLSKSVSELEKEMGITIFYRNNRGVYLSEDGSKFLSYARQVMEQAELLEQQYKQKDTVRRVFAVSSQHYAFVVNAFVALVKEYGKNKYEFTLRESRTHDIIEDVRTSRSELGILFLSNFNREVILRILQNADLKYTSLFTAKLMFL